MQVAEALQALDKSRRADQTTAWAASSPAAVRSLRAKLAQLGREAVISQPGAADEYSRQLRTQPQAQAAADTAAAKQAAADAGEAAQAAAEAAFSQLMAEEEAEAASAAQRSQQQAAKKAAKKARQQQRKQVLPTRLSRQRGAACYVRRGLDCNALAAGTRASANYVIAQHFNDY